MKVAKILAIAALSSLALVGTGFTQGKTWTKITIATEGAYAPWNFTEAGGKLNGFEVELAQELCKRMKVECQVIAQDWDGIIPALQAGKYDAIMAGMNITPKRLEVINFSRIYAGGPSSFGVLRDGPLAALPGLGQRYNLATNEAEAIKAIEAMKALLKGKTIGVQVSTIQGTFIEKYLKDVVTVREYKTTEEHDLDLINGRLDAIFSAQTAMTATMEKPEFKNMMIAGPGFAGGVLGIGVAVGLRKTDPELKVMFDKAIEELLADGTLSKLSVKWFHTDISPQS